MLNTLRRLTLCKSNARATKTQTWSWWYKSFINIGAVVGAIWTIMKMMSGKW